MRGQFYSARSTFLKKKQTTTIKCFRAVSLHLDAWALLIRGLFQTIQSFLGPKNHSLTLYTPYIMASYGPLCKTYTADLVRHLQTED